MIKVRAKWCTCRENDITLSKIDRSVVVLPPLYFGLENSTNTRIELADPVMGTIVLVGERAKRARCYLVMSMESRDIYNIYIYHSCCGNSHGIKVIYPA